MNGITKVLVTGADGFLGSNLIRALLNRGYEPRALIYNGNSAKTLSGLDIELVKGDVLSVETIKQAADSCQGIIHAAAATEIFPPKSEAVRNVNITGTRNIADIAKEQKTKKLVYVGSASSFGPGPKHAPGDETKDYYGSVYNLDYFDSKRMAQEIVLDETRKGLLPAVVVNPTFMFGPFDVKPGSGEIVIKIHNRSTLPRTAGGRNCVSVKDVSVGIVNALEFGRIGESYILGHENLTYTELFEKIAAVLKKRVPKLYLPKFVAKTIGFVNENCHAMIRKKPRANFTFAKIATAEHYYSSAKAVREINLPQTPIETPIGEAFDWFKINGYLSN